MSARPVDIIARVINMRDAETVEEKLTAGGYRILAPGELDPETVERCAEIAEQTPWYRHTSPDHVAANKPADFAAAIRSLGRPQP